MIKVTQTVLDACVDPLKQFLLEYKKKAVFRSMLEVKENRHHIDGKCYNVQILDMRVNPPFVVGTIHVELGPDYVVSSENIKNERYAYYNGNYHTKRTKDIKKAIKNAIEHLRPFRWSEYAAGTRAEVGGLLKKWAIAPYRTMETLINHEVSTQAILDEVSKQLKDNENFAFKTDAFNKAAKTISENYQEAARRANTDYRLVFFHIDQQGRYVNDEWPAPKFESDMPQELLEKVSLLKLVEVPPNKDSVKAGLLEEVGVRVGERDFWLFVPKEIYGQLFTPKS